MRVFTVMPPDEAAMLVEDISTTLSFQRGLSSVEGKPAFKVATKLNQEHYREAGLLDNKILMHPEVQEYVKPEKATSGRFNLYVPGNYYKPHTDAEEIMGVRTDYAYTLLLTPPNTYDGGELRIGKQRHKLEAGQMVIYPCGELHEVTTVTRGFRLALIGWIQSAYNSYRSPLSDNEVILL